MGIIVQMVPNSIIRIEHFTGRRQKGELQVDVVNQYQMSSISFKYQLARVNYLV